MRQPPELEFTAQRLKVIERLLNGKPIVVVSTIQSLIKMHHLTLWTNSALKCKSDVCFLKDIIANLSVMDMKG